MTDEIFGRRLRAERERRQITLESIAGNTKIGIALLRGLERGDVSRWPAGIFRRSFMRGYASAIGLDPDELLKEFLERFPEARDEAIAAASSAGEPVAPRPAPAAGLRLTLADPRPPFSAGRVLARARARLAAAAWDAGTVLGLGVTAFVVLDEFWAPLAIATLGYFLISILALGNTPGVCLFAPRPVPEDPAPAEVDAESDAALHDLAPSSAFRRGSIA